jgi:uncharacterized protein YjiS (DUF1127 family)
MALQVGTAPNLEVETTERPVRFHDWIYYRGLTPDQRQRVIKHIIRHAQAARAQAFYDLGGAVVRALQAAASGGAAIIRVVAKAIIAAATKWCRAYAIRRARNAAVRELDALDDRMLRDIGVGRSEIEWVVVHGRDVPQLHWASQTRSSHSHNSSSGDADLVRRRVGSLTMSTRGGAGISVQRVVSVVSHRRQATVPHGAGRQR